MSAEIDLGDDVTTPESLVAAAYKLLSGRASDKRDWDRWRALHAPGARLIPIEKRDDGAKVARVMTPDEFIASRGPFLSENDFFEWETERQELRYGDLVHVWSKYEAAHEVGGHPIRIGVNSIQLWHDGARWWILTVAWDTVEAMAKAITETLRRSKAA